MTRRNVVPMCGSEYSNRDTFGSSAKAGATAAKRANARRECGIFIECTFPELSPVESIIHATAFEVARNGRRRTASRAGDGASRQAGGQASARRGEDPPKLYRNRRGQGVGREG